MCARHPEILKARLVVDRGENQDVMTLHCEVADASADLATAIGESLQAACTVRGRVDLVDAGSLANDGKVIDDIRKLD